jgi:hypothetical protein
MPLSFDEGASLDTIMQESFLLKSNPFKISSTYNLDKPDSYEPRMYGNQYDEFLKKFFIIPLNRGEKKQLIGAIWSTQSSSDWRGFGKSMLMAEESKRICRDFGASALRHMKVTQKDVAAHPILAGYCTFDRSKDIQYFPAALLDAVAFILEGPYGDGGETTVHQELRNRIIGKIEAEDGYEGEAIRRALTSKLWSYRGLNVQLTHKTLADFIDRLSSRDTASLIGFIRQGIGPRIKAGQGFNFVHVFNAFALLAGVEYVVYFIDQIENFAKFARYQERDIKILRESMVQTSPTADMASFVFQMHVSALKEIEDWWNAEHLPSLDFQIPLNRTRTINLKGLQTTEEACILATAYLKDHRVEGAHPASPLHPFPKEVIEAVRDAEKGNPRKFLETLGQILDQAILDERTVIDLVFVEPLLGGDYQDVDDGDEDDDYENIER